MYDPKSNWDRLAKENPRYFVFSDLGRDIDEETFKKTGFDDYKKYIDEDPLIEKGTDLLELGCGNGRMSEFIDEEFHLTATDISPEMVRCAKERLPEINFMETDGYLLPFENNSFDVVFSYLVFQHMKRRKIIESNFKEVYRILRPKGLFKVLMRADRLKTMRWWWCGAYYNEQMANDLSIRSGFTVLKMQKIGNYGLWLWLEK